MSALSLDARAERNFQAYQAKINVRTDRLFAWVMILQYVLAVVFALATSPLTYSGPVAHLHPHVLTALLLGGALASYPVVLATRQPGAISTRFTIALAQALFSALLIHLTDGRIETHFHVFGSLAFLAMYRDWRILIAFSGVVALDHVGRGVFFPLSIYGTSLGASWRFLEHAGWVVFEDVFLLIGLATTVREMRLTASHEAEVEIAQERLEEHNAHLEDRVRERTLQLEDSQREIVERLARVGDYRDDETGDHSRRVGDMACTIALALGVEPGEADVLRLAAPLHDIGKVAVPDSVLRKPGRLTEEEFDEMRRHVQVGAEVLADGRSEILRMAYVVALHHHERWDGTGYGQGLSGEAIPLPGRIVAVADVFDALTSERPYKRRWSVDEAVQEIVRSAGSHFDPAVVEAFVRVLGAEAEAERPALPLAA